MKLIQIAVQITVCSVIQIRLSTLYHDQLVRLNFPLAHHWVLFLFALEWHSPMTVVVAVLHQALIAQLSHPNCLAMVDLPHSKRQILSLNLSSSVSQYYFQSLCPYFDPSTDSIQCRRFFFFLFLSQIHFLLVHTPNCASPILCYDQYYSRIRCTSKFVPLKKPKTKKNRQRET